MKWLLFLIFIIFNLHVYAESELYVNPKNSIKAGEYLAVIAGCHDCHTPNFAKNGGNVPAKDYLTGVSYGFKGPWGVTYAANLRLLVQQLTEKEWMNFLKYSTGRPPMPWAATHKMSEDDLGSLYKYIKSLGGAGVDVPIATGPNETPKTDYIYYVPVKNMPK